jgi:hypothetical protein
MDGVRFRHQRRRPGTWTGPAWPTVGSPLWMARCGSRARREDRGTTVHAEIPLPGSRAIALIRCVWRSRDDNYPGPPEGTRRLLEGIPGEVGVVAAVGSAEELIRRGRRAPAGRCA